MGELDERGRSTDVTDRAIENIKARIEKRDKVSTNMRRNAPLASPPARNSARGAFEAASVGRLEDGKVIYITPRRPARRAARDARRPRRRIRRPMRRPCRRDCRRSMPTVCASAGSDATRAGAVTAIAAAANQPNSLRRETCSNIQTSQSSAARGSVADAAWAWQTRRRSRELGHWRANN